MRRACITGTTAIVQVGRVTQVCVVFVAVADILFIAVFLGY